MSTRRVLGTMAAFVWGLITLMAPSVAMASAVCPPPPHTVAGLIAADSEQGGPLTDQFRPVYGVYPEAAASCWIGEEIRVTAFVASPEGLGGTTSFTIAPAWLVPGRSGFLSATDTIDPDIGPIGPFLPVAVPPSHERAFDASYRRWVSVSGHFGDPLAETCVVTESDPAIGPVPSAGQAIEICETAFVLTDIRRLDTPRTDSAVRPSGRQVMIWDVAVIGLATAVAFAFVMFGLSRARP